MFEDTAQFFATFVCKSTE